MQICEAGNNLLAAASWRIFSIFEGVSVILNYLIAFLIAILQSEKYQHKRLYLLNKSSLIKDCFLA